MSEFLRLVPPSESLQILLDALPMKEAKAEWIDTIESKGRVLALDVIANHPLPEFARSAVDGYAVRAEDTFGVSDSLPGYLKLIGDVPMGKTNKIKILPGTCAGIHTGGMLPDGADAVVMLEHTQIVTHAKARKNTSDTEEAWRSQEIEIYRPTVKGENVLGAGEDVNKGEVVLSAGKRIRPVDIGVCMAFGQLKLRVVVPPRIGIISSGDEVISPKENPTPGQVRDINSFSLSSLVQEWGGEPISYGIVPDDLEKLKLICRQALEACDVVVITAGSSASSRDMTATAIASLGSPGVLVHGVNVRPGKPTILAVCSEKAVVGLPGNPASALVIARLFIKPVINRLLGIKEKEFLFTVAARLSTNLPSQSGREEWVAVRLVTRPCSKNRGEQVEYYAEPIFGKSNFIVSLARADGFIRIPPDSTGINAQEIVDVISL